MVSLQRKVIQIADSTQLISLPRKWAIKYNIKKGDALDVEDKGNKVIVSTEKGIEFNEIELDLTGLDRSSIMHLIRAVYKKGYDEMAFKFQNPTTPHFRLKHEEKVISIIHQECNRLVGAEIIKQKEDFCLIKVISQGSIKELDTILRRIFILLRDAHQELIKALEEGDLILLETIEEKHDTISKFVSYCLRLISKHGYGNEQRMCLVYHTIASLDKIADVIKYVAREGLNYKKPISKQTHKVLESINSSIRSYCEFFYRFDKDRIVEFMKNRDEARHLISSYSKNISPQENIILNRMENNLEILLDLVEARMGIEY